MNDFDKNPELEAIRERMKDNPDIKLEPCQEDFGTVDEYKDAHMDWLLETIQKNLKDTPEPRIENFENEPEYIDAHQKWLKKQEWDISPEPRPEDFEQEWEYDAAHEKWLFKEGKDKMVFLAGELDPDLKEYAERSEFAEGYAREEQRERNLKRQLEVDFRSIGMGPEVRAEINDEWMHLIEDNYFHHQRNREQPI